MYSKERANSIVKNDVKYISTGIIENVSLKSARSEVSPNGNRFLEITFEKDGATLVHTEWEPVIGQFVTSQEELQKKADNQYSRMLQILVCFYKDEEINFEGESFKEFANYVATMLNNANKDIKLRVKVVYNDKGYTTLPNYAKYTFIEPMVLPEGKTSAIVKLNIDKFEKPVVADKEAKNDNPFASSTTTNTTSIYQGSESMTTPPTQGETTSSDDLPF